MSGELPESITSMREKIAALSEKEVSEHVLAYEEIHSDLQRALSEIEGL
ncbi:MAG: hypothetical protein ACKO3U_00085 [Actinomycetota bacterium]